MTWVIVRHRVEDYKKWKPIFDESKPWLKEAGAVKGYLMRDTDDEQVISVALVFPDKASAEKFFASERLKDGMKRGGVQGKPEFHYMEPLEEVVLDEAEASRKAA